MTRDEFKKEHNRCPNCYSRKLVQTLVGIAESDGVYFDDKNTATCGCGWSGKVHELRPASFEFKLIEWGRVTANGHIYTPEHVELPPKGILFGTIERLVTPFEIPLGEMAAIGRPEKRSDGLYVKADVYDHPIHATAESPVNTNGTIFLECLRAGCHVIPEGYGQISEDGATVENYKIISFYLRKESLYND